MAFLEIENLQKTFGANSVVRDFDLAIEQGELARCISCLTTV